MVLSGIQPGAPSQPVSGPEAERPYVRWRELQVIEDSADILGMNQCRLCKTSIEPKAAKCPHCLGWQTRVLPDMHSPLGSALILVPTVVFLVVFLFFVGDKPVAIGPKVENFTLTETTLGFSDCCGDNFYIAIVGKITNDGDAAAEAPHFEARFYDSEGELIDSLATDSYDLVIAPHTEATFRVRGPAQHQEKDYAAHDVRLTKIRSPSRF